METKTNELRVKGEGRVAYVNELLYPSIRIVANSNSRPWLYSKAVVRLT